MWKKRSSLNISTFITLIFALYGAYYLLLHENFMHSSIACIIANANHLTIKPHLLILGLLPIYIALVIFGAVMLGIFIGPRLECVVSRATFRAKRRLR